MMPQSSLAFHFHPHLVLSSLYHPLTVIVVAIDVIVVTPLSNYGILIPSSTHHALPPYLGTVIRLWRAGHSNQVEPSVTR